MIHPEHQRRAYLQAMGIDVWLPRDAAEPEDAPVAAAGTAGAEDLDWDELRQCVADCTRCALSLSRRQTVFGVGNQNADWMIVGEAPGAEEDRRGEPFVGPAGKMLDEMLRAIGLTRESVFVANTLKCRPPDNRDPKPTEAEACRDYLDRQIELVQPKIILAVGKIAAQNLLQCDDPVGRMRGTAHNYNGVPLVVTYHPAYLLRSPAQKRKTWSDLCLAMRLTVEGAA
jgi:uracil-DNA glycosylase family 4